MMNFFRLAGDMAHVLSILVLLLRLRVTKNAVGISVKTQELYLVVFVTRYLDLFTTFYSYYNTMMKILYIGTTSYIIYMIRKTEPFSSTYDKAHDSFLHWKFAVLPCAIVALITNVLQGFDVMEVSLNKSTFFGSQLHETVIYYQLLWVFSIYLEALTIVPQLILLQRYREVENLTGHYVFLLGIYRALYIANWVYRSYHEPFYKHSWIVYVCGFVQTCLYLDFFYYYFQR